MIERLKNNLLYKKVTGVEFTGDVNTFSRINVVKVVTKKNEICIKDCRSFNSLDNFFEFLDKDTPLVITVNGWQVLHKKVDSNGDEDDENLLSNSFPNFSNKEFYYQKSQINSPNVFYSVIRKENLNELTRIFEDKGLFILKIYLGPFCLNSVRRYLDLSQDVRISDYVLRYDDSQIISIEYKNCDDYKDISIGDESINSKLLFAYSSIVDFFLGKSDANLSIENKLSDNFVYKTYTKYLMFLFLVSILIVLIINAIVYLRYRDEIGKIYQDYTFKKEKAVELDSLTMVAQRKRDYLVKNNFVELSRTTFYVDRLSSLKPSGIWFQEVNVFPLKTDSVGESEEEFEFEKRQIIVSGEANNAYVLNTWLERIRNEKWVSSVTLNKIKQVEIPDVTYFSIEIKLKL